MRNRKSPRKAAPLLPPQSRHHFDEFIGSFDAYPKVLYGTHVTSVSQLVSIIETLELKCQLCKIFGKELLYTFYGRAAYRMKTDHQVTRHSTLMPVVLVLDYSRCPEPSQIFPFDTGAFARGPLKLLSDGYVSLENFSMTPTIDRTTRLVQGMFGNNERYMRNNLGNIRLPEDQVDNLELSNYVRMILDSGSLGDNGRALDQRVSSIEVAFSCNISVSEAVSAVILPDVFKTGKHSGALLSQLGIELFPYAYVEGVAPKEAYGLINDLVRRIYDREGLLP